MTQLFKFCVMVKYHAKLWMRLGNLKLKII